MSILGVPPNEIGKLQYEGWGFKSTKFIGVDELVMREAVKRKLNLEKHYVDMMIYGYINKSTWQDIRTPVVEPEPEPESEDDDEDDSEEEGTVHEERRFFGEDSEEDEEQRTQDAEDENEMDVDAYGLPEASTEGQKLGKFKGNPGT